MFAGGSVRLGHVTCSSCVYLYDFGSLTTIQLTIVLRTSAVVIRCLCSPLGVLGVPLPSFLNSNRILGNKSGRESERIGSREGLLWFASMQKCNIWSLNHDAWGYSQKSGI